MIRPPALPPLEPPVRDGFAASAPWEPARAPPPRTREPRVDDAAFDAWLRRELRRLHDAVLSEPVPDHLLRILEGQDGG